jgi:hypothetical protein
MGNSRGHVVSLEGRSVEESSGAISGLLEAEAGRLEAVVLVDRVLVEVEAAVPVLPENLGVVCRSRVERRRGRSHQRVEEQEMKAERWRRTEEVEAVGSSAVEVRALALHGVSVVKGVEGPAVLELGSAEAPRENRKNPRSQRTLHQEKVDRSERGLTLLRTRLRRGASRSADTREVQEEERQELLLNREQGGKKETHLVAEGGALGR